MYINTGGRSSRSEYYSRGVLQRAARAPAAGLCQVQHGPLRAGVRAMLVDQGAAGLRAAPPARQPSLPPAQSRHTRAF